MILIVTNKEDITADYLIIELERKKYDYVRFNTEDFPQKIQIHFEPNNSKQSHFIFPKRSFPFSNIRAVWYRRPADPVPNKNIEDPLAKTFCIRESRETIEGILESLECFFISKPSNIRKAENKLLQLTTASKVGLKIPKTVITNIPNSALNLYETTHNTILKPIRCGRLNYPEGLKLIYTNIVKSEDVKHFDLVQYSATLFQQLIPKKADIRVTIIGREIYPVAIYPKDASENLIDWRKKIENGLKYIHHELPKDISEKCLKLMSILGVNFSAMDFILTNSGEYYFLEMNPNGQWAWIQDLTGLSMRESLADLLHKGSI